jgi:heat shock protein HslJ
MMRFSVPVMAATSLLMIAVPSFAATPDNWAKVDAASQTACIKASGLSGAQAGPPTRYSDKFLIEARVVEGTWPQPHMKGAKARILCLYNRKSKRVEVQEFAEPVARVAVVKDIWWRAESIGGQSVADGSEVTMMLGSDGKIGGKSGCNGYSARYQITGNSLQIFPPMIGTRMACAPGIMAQEQTYQTLLEEAKSFAVTPEGRLILTSAGGATTTFVRK